MVRNLAANAGDVAVTPDPEDSTCLEAVRPQHQNPLSPHPESCSAAGKEPPHEKETAQQEDSPDPHPNPLRPEKAYSAQHSLHSDEPSTAKNK